MCKIFTQREETVVTKMVTVVYSGISYGISNGIVGYDVTETVPLSKISFC